MHYLVTGGAGFIGSNFIRLCLRERADVRITNLDALTYAGNLATLAGIEDEFPGRYRFLRGDIADPATLDTAFADGGFDAVVNFAAESHVDRSIDGPEVFVRTNVTGAYRLLEKARTSGVKRFVQISTDEVYGSLGDDGLFTESTPLNPSSPYSASKAGADLLVLANHHTFGQDVVVTRCSNNYGPWQYPEKLIPLMIIRAMHGDSLPVYGDGRNVRDWIHVADHCAGILTALEDGKPGQVYNFGANTEWRNIEIVRTILKLLGKPESLISFVTDRPGHDRRYAIDSTKARTELGWEPEHRFEDALAQTIQWYIANPGWWRPLLKKSP